MKAVALILALAVITGCNARVVRQADATRLNNLEENVERFLQYINGLKQKADGVVEDLSNSQLSRELDTLISDTMSELTAYIDNVKNKHGLSPENFTSMTQDLQLLVNKLQGDLLDAKERSTEYLGEVQTMTEQTRDDVHRRINTYAHKLKKRLSKDTEEIRNTVTTYLGDIQSHASSNTKKLSDIYTGLTSQFEDLGQQLQTQAESIMAKFQELCSTMEGSISDLTERIPLYGTKIREQ